MEDRDGCANGLFIFPSVFIVISASTMVIFTGAFAALASAAIEGTLVSFR